MYILFTVGKDKANKSIMQEKKIKKHLTDITINGNKHIDGCMQVCFLSLKISIIRLIKIRKFFIQIKVDISIVNEYVYLY